MSNDPVKCPACGSLMEFVPDGEALIPTYSLGTRRVEPKLTKCPFVACTGCEFIYDGTVFHGLDPSLIPA